MAAGETAGPSIPLTTPTSATPLPLSSRPELRRSVAEGSAVRPAALSNPSWEATRRNHPLRIKPAASLLTYPQQQSRGVDFIGQPIAASRWLL
jgi:hypothetical protein